MSKKHHPHTRAERIALRELDEKPKRPKVWRKLSPEALEHWKIRHEHEQVADDRNPEGKHT